MIMSPLPLALAMLAIVLAAITQRATGMGGGLVAAPLLAMVSLDLVPGPLIFASLALSGLMTANGRGDIRFSRIGFVAAGIAVGSVGGALLINALPPDRFGAAFGAMILGAIALSCAGLKIPQRSGSMFLTGLVSGVMGTTAAIGAPPLALLYQHEEARVLRATLAFLFLLSAIVMLVMLNRVGRFGQAELVNGLLLMPGFVFGYFAARGLSAFMDRGHARNAVLILSTVSALVVIAKSMYPD